MKTKKMRCKTKFVFENETNYQLLIDFFYLPTGAPSASPCVMIHILTLTMPMTYKKMN